MTVRQQQLLILPGAILTGLILAAALLIASMLASATATAAPSPYSGLTRRVTSDGAPVLGSLSAPITIVEFVDFSCPHCASYQTTIQDIIQRYITTGQARLEVRILAGLDPVGSPVAARAALCAGEQNAFWEMHDQLLRLQQTYGRSAFSEARIREAAEKLRLNSADLWSCVNSAGRYQEALQSNVDLAINLDVKNLPAVLLRRGSSRPAWIEHDGHPMTGSVPPDVLRAAIEASLAAVSQ